MLENISERMRAVLKWRPLSNGWGVIGALVVGVMSLIGPQVVLEPLMPWFSGLLLTLDHNTRLSIIRLVVELLAVLVIFVGIKMYRRSWADVGLRRPKISQVGFALIGFGVYMGATIVINVLVSMFFNIDQDQAQKLGYDGLSGAALVWAFVVLVVATPLSEELIFRGFLYSGFRRRLPFWATAICVSALFGLVHGQWNVGIDVFAMSMVSCYMREESGSLWPSIFLHALKNCLAFYLLYVLHLQ
jgi:membrane protease YdiL (CAAX protease family)